MRRPFMIVSELNGKVMDIRGGSSAPKTEVIMWQRKYDRSPNQLWYMDEMGYLKSMLNDFAPHSKRQGDQIRMKPYKGKPCQQWRIEGNRIVNRSNECMDIQGSANHDAANVISWHYKGSPNQHWRMEYV